MSDTPSPPDDGSQDARDRIRANDAKGTNNGCLITFAAVLVLALALWGCSLLGGSAADSTDARAHCETEVIMRLGLPADVDITPGTTAHSGSTWNIGGAVVAGGTTRIFMCTEVKQSDGSFVVSKITGLS